MNEYNIYGRVFRKILIKNLSTNLEQVHVRVEYFSHGFLQKLLENSVLVDSRLVQAQIVDKLHPDGPLADKCKVFNLLCRRRLLKKVNNKADKQKLCAKYKNYFKTHIITMVV